mmetsp:Transcript_99722/g.171753  ORF Transcript_99722/g.171753 Transcript_99722/m.171753 type:complete len:203 (+) Transcript_99722:1842-2450(+)
MAIKMSWEMTLPTRNSSTSFSNSVRPRRCTRSSIRGSHLPACWVRVSRLSMYIFCTRSLPFSSRRSASASVFGCSTYSGSSSLMSASALRILMSTDRSRNTSARYSRSVVYACSLERPLMTAREWLLLAVSSVGSVAGPSPLPTTAGAPKSSSRASVEAMGEDGRSTCRLRFLEVGMLSTSEHVAVGATGATVAPSLFCSRM